jgi:hypothetical protein
MKCFSKWRKRRRPSRPRAVAKINLQPTLALIA